MSRQPPNSHVLTPMSSATDSLPPVNLPVFKVDSTYGAALIGKITHIYKLH